MNLEKRLKNLKTRLKAASKAFINPVSTPKQTLLIKTVDPGVVLDNQLLAGKNVLITGAARNIGRSIAIEMAKQGANVFCTDINEQGCRKLEEELKAYPVKSKCFLSNLAKTEEIDTLCESLTQEKIVIDILVNNVGISPQKLSIKTLDLKEFQEVFNTNIFGSVYLTKQITNGMINQKMGGSIIFITSIHQWTIRGIMSYSASKAALGMIIQELALELAPDQIRVNGIAPGWIELDAQGNPLNSKHTPLYQCSIDPCYIGRSAVYLASDYFSYSTTGTVLKIDAGLSLYNHLVNIMQS